MSPRPFRHPVPFAALCLALSSPACVSQARYDDTKTALDQATEGRDAEKRHAAELEATLDLARQALEQEREKASQANGALERESELLARVRFEADVIGREREEAKQMSDQLLLELERIGAHLRAFADDKALLGEQRAELARELEGARARLAALALDEKANQQRFLAARELTLALAEPLEEKSLRLSLVDGDIAIQFPMKAAFTANGANLTEQGKAALEKAASVLRPLALRVRVSQPESTQGALERAQAVSDALLAFGFTEDRVILPELASAATPPEPSEASLEPPAEQTPGAEPAEAVAVSADDNELELRLSFPASES